MLHIDAEQLQALQQASGGDGDGGQLLLVDQSVGVVKQEAEEPLEEERKDIVEDIKHQIRELVCIYQGHIELEKKVFRVTLPYLNLLGKPRIYFRFS